MKKILFRFLASLDKSIIQDYIVKEYQKPQELKELELAFIDSNGKAWYQFPEGLGNPMKRIASNLQAYEYLTARLSPEMFDAAMNDVNVALANGQIVEAGAILKRLTSLRDEVVPLDVLINLIANDLFREDESLTTDNANIHQEKCDYLKGAIERGDSFFFRLRVVNDLSERFKISKSNWRVILDGFQEAANQAKKERELILSMSSESA